LLDFLKSGGSDEFPEEAQLIGTLARYFSDSGLYDIIPAPEETKPLWRVRLEIAAGAAERNPKEVPRWRQEMIDSVETPALRALLKEAFEKAPPGYYQAPSSSSGRFHPADEVNSDLLDPEKMGAFAKPADVYTGGGLVLHTRRVVEAAKALTTFLGIKGVERDHIIASAALHDVMKFVKAEDVKKVKPGEPVPWGEYTTPDHGLAGALWLSRLDSAKNGIKTKDIARFVEKHMSAWNKPETSPPTDFGEMVVSMSDYMASQPGWYVKV
ncbi:MAG: HD domain-containing protein, partial [Armatimonadetes bacterium]|nr:HD domain-containing protein [Armatimonadota bacterium]